MNVLVESKHRNYQLHAYRQQVHAIFSTATTNTKYGVKLPLWRHGHYDKQRTNVISYHGEYKLGFCIYGGQYRYVYVHVVIDN